MRVWCKQKTIKQSQYWIHVRLQQHICFCLCRNSISSFKNTSGIGSVFPLHVSFCHVMNLVDLMISSTILSHGFLPCPTHMAHSWEKKLSPRFRSLDWRLASSPPMTLKTSVSNKSLLRSESEVPPICFTVASPSAICRETWNQTTLGSMMHNRFSTPSFKCMGRRCSVCIFKLG